MKNKIIKTIGAAILCLSLLSGCGRAYNNSTQQSSAPEATVMYYKTIPVTVTNVRQDYYNTKTNEYGATVEAESKEYNLHGIFTLNGGFMGGNDYVYDAYYGKIKDGDIIYAEMYSWKQGDKTIRRELVNLRYPD